MGSSCLRVEAGDETGNSFNLVGQKSKQGVALCPPAVGFLPHSSYLWWTFPTKSARVADKSLASLDRYHFDLDDWHALKFFFYLTDVDQDSGPHVYVVVSHRRRSLKHQLTLLVGDPTDEIVGFYGPDSLLTITGPAGKGFVEDPFGFHMGTVPNKAPRLMMEVGFGVSRPLRRDLHGEPVLRP